MLVAQRKLSSSRHYYECGICNCLHPLEWNGDCREDAARFAPDELDEFYTSRGGSWELVPMPGSEEE